MPSAFEPCSDATRRHGQRWELGSAARSGAAVPTAGWALEGVEGVSHCEVQLDDGSARVHLAPTAGDVGAGLNALDVERRCEEALRGAGFDTK